MYSPEESGNVLLSEKLKSSLGKPVILTVYNMITQEKREVEVIPRANSEQILKADDLSSKDLIGVDLRFEKYDDVHEMVYLIDSVQVSSPAFHASLGIDPLGDLGKDYIIGSSTKSRFETTLELSEFLYKNDKLSCSLNVFNTKQQVVREV